MLGGDGGSGRECDSPGMGGDSGGGRGVSGGGVAAAGDQGGLAHRAGP